MHLLIPGIFLEGSIAGITGKSTITKHYYWIKSFLIKSGTQVLDSSQCKSITSFHVLRERHGEERDKWTKYREIISQPIDPPKHKKPGSERQAKICLAFLMHRHPIALSICAHPISIHIIFSI